VELLNQNKNGQHQERRGIGLLSHQWVFNKMISDEKLQLDVEQYIARSVAQSFPDGLPDGKTAEIIISVMINSFRDGMAYSESIRDESKSRIVTC